MDKNKKLELEGKIFSTNNCGNLKIIEYNGATNVIVEFITTKTIHSTTMSNIKSGSVSDPMYPTVYGVGYMGIGEYKSRIGTNPQTVCYKRWKEILNRCYNPECSAYKFYGGNGAFICEEWKNFQNFASWWYSNFPNWEGIKIAIDKDLLCKGNKEYCPEYCCFLPQEINEALTLRKKERGDYPVGVRLKEGKIIAQINYMGNKKHLGTFSTVKDAFAKYKIEKEKCMKEYADKYKNILSERVYQALYNYTINIDD